MVPPQRAHSTSNPYPDPSPNPNPYPNPNPNPNQVSNMLVDGVSVSQLYEMRSEKEERRAGGLGVG